MSQGLDAEVIVVGGGPAGAATAWSLSREGADVLVLDRARFPRDKICAEYLSPQASRILSDMRIPGRWIRVQWRREEEFGFEPVGPAMVLGPLMEENLRRALLISRGDWSVFITRPLSAVLMATALGLLILAVLPTLRKKRDEVFVESEN